MTEFSVERAFEHLHGIATEPHPAGSAANDRVRGYLVEQLTELGLEVQVQDSVGVGVSTPTPYGPRYLGAGRVQNIVARLAGSEPGRAIALMSHYDSVAQGPGANDAGVPVCAILESVRVLSERTRRRDLVVVFTDGEECGLLGARAFFAEHPLASTIDVVLNLEARGDRGPLLMFETTPGNGPVIKALSRANRPVVTSSLFYEVYRRLPNATDFSVSKEHGVPGLNFAHIGGFVHYHGPLDDIASVDRRVLREHGELVLGLVRELDGVAARQLLGGDDVFFSLFGKVVRYPVTAAVPLAVAAGTAWLAVTSGRRAGLLKGLGALAGRLAAGGAGATALAWALGRLSPEFRRSGDFYRSDDVFGALVAFSAAGSLLGGDPGRRVLAASAPLALASGVVAAKLAGGSYLTVWPLLGATASIATSGSSSAVVRRLGGAASAVSGAVLLGPLSRLLFQGLTPRMSGTSAVVLQLLGELAAPAAGALPAKARKRLAIGAALTGAAFVARAALARRGERQPEPETLSYLLDADTGTARWLSSDAGPTSWTRRVLGERPERGTLPAYFPGWTREFLHASAPVLDLPAPQVRVLSEEVVDETRGIRRVSLEVRSRRGARQMSISAPDGGVHRWAVDGRAVTAEQAGVGRHGQVWELWLHALPDKGFRLDLDLPAQPVPVRVADRSDGLTGELQDRLRDGGPEPAGRGWAPALDVDSWGNATFTLLRLEL
ncbi:M28 family peptidase [Lentzea sp. NEAU-D13]|uniref:Vacuolar membrane protease n=1 Tax=Lentzea alba TaxID=2714351 RepID=A0A7C9RTP9_9PSEU|nr:M28 family peptidase [Lentzea alba]NGY63165.1 M28 family peptidase [Lentzea alba]